MNKYLDKALAWLKDLFSNKTDTDPKLVVGVLCTLLWLFMVGYHMYSHFNIQSELIWANVGLIAACFGLDVVNAVNAMKTKGFVASDIAKSDSSKATNDSATDVIQSDKP